MGKTGRTVNFSQKSYKSTQYSDIFKTFLRLKFFYPNLRLRVCLAKCLIFQQSEPSVLINRVLTEKKMCIRITRQASLVTRHTCSLNCTNTKLSRSLLFFRRSQSVLSYTNKSSYIVDSFFDLLFLICSFFMFPLAGCFVIAKKT